MCKFHGAFYFKTCNIFVRNLITISTDLSKLVHQRFTDIYISIFRPYTKKVIVVLRPTMRAD